MAKARIDIAALHAALDAQRKALGMTWRQVAAGAGVSPSTFSRVRQGKRPDVDSFAAMISWLGVPSERFFRSETDEARERARAEPIAVISSHLRAQKDLSPESAEALEELLHAAAKLVKSTDD